MLTERVDCLRPERTQGKVGEGYGGKGTRSGVESGWKLPRVSLFFFSLMIFIKPINNKFISGLKLEVKGNKKYGLEWG